MNVKQRAVYALRRIRKERWLEFLRSPEELLREAKEYISKFEDALAPAPVCEWEYQEEKVADSRPEIREAAATGCTISARFAYRAGDSSTPPCCPRGP